MEPDDFQILSSCATYGFNHFTDGEYILNSNLRPLPLMRVVEDSCPGSRTPFSSPDGGQRGGWGVPAPPAVPWGSARWVPLIPGGTRALW